MADRTTEIAVRLTAIDRMTAIVGKAITGLNKIKTTADRIAQSSFANGRRFAAVGLSIAAMLAIPLKSAADMERMNIALKTSFQGNEVAAQQAFQTINKFAAATPYGLQEVMTGFIKLKNMGLDPSIVSLTAYGNTASAMGKSLNDMVEAVADAATGEFERLKEFGIRASQSATQVKFTFQGVTTTVAKNSKAIENYLKKLGNTKFAGGIESQSKSLYGQLSTLSDNAMMTASAIGTTLIPEINKLFKEVQPVVDLIQVWVMENPELTQTMLKVIVAAAALSFTISVLSFAFGGLSKAVSFTTATFAFFSRVTGWLIAGNLRRLAISLVSSLTPAVGLITKAMTWLNVVMAMNPVLLVVMAVVALVAAFILAYNKCEKFRATIDGLVSVGKILLDVFKAIGKILVGIWDRDPKKILSGFSDIGNITNYVAKGGIQKSFKKGYDASIEASKVAKANEKFNSNMGVGGVPTFVGATPQMPSQPVPFNSGNSTTNNKPTFSPNITIHLNGSATKTDGKMISASVKEQFEKMMKDYEARQKRLSYQ